MSVILLFLRRLRRVVLAGTVAARARFALRLPGLTAVTRAVLAMQDNGVVLGASARQALVVQRNRATLGQSGWAAVLRVDPAAVALSGSTSRAVIGEGE